MNEVWVLTRDFDFSGVSVVAIRETLQEILDMFPPNAWDGATDGSLLFGNDFYHLYSDDFKSDSGCVRQPSYYGSHGYAPKVLEAR